MQPLGHTKMTSEWKHQPYVKYNWGG